MNNDNDEERITHILHIEISEVQKFKVK